MEFFFLELTQVGQVKEVNLGEDLFFWTSPDFDKNKRFNLIQD